MKTTKSKVWENHKGEEVPAKYVPTLDKKQDRIVRAKIKKVLKLETDIENLRKELFEDGDQLWLEMQEAEGVRTGKKSYTISTFDKKQKIEVAQAERVEFDSKIEIAKALIDEYLEEKLTGVDDEIKQFVHRAFETKNGNLDVKEVLGLFKFKIKHPKWQRAMTVINESMSRNNSKRYVRAYVKDDMGEYKQVKLNF